MRLGLTSRAGADQPPIKIGMSMPQTGGLAGGGKASLLGIEIWRDDVNARGGLLGRKVELVVYDDKSSASETPAIYSKLLDVDKVDLLFAPYATVPTAPIMPLVKQRGMVLIGNFSFQVNSKVGHDMWFNNAPWGPADSWASAFLDLGQKAGGKTVALLSADQEFAQNLAHDRARCRQASANMPIVFDQAYPPNTVEFSEHHSRAQCRQARHRLCRVLSAGFGRHLCAPSTRSGSATTSRFSAAAWSACNSARSWRIWVRCSTASSTSTPGCRNRACISTGPRRSSRPIRSAPWKPRSIRSATIWRRSASRCGQLIEQAVKATNSLDQKAIAKYLRENVHQTIVGPIAFAADGERKETATLEAQFRGVVDKNIDQFRSLGQAGDPVPGPIEVR